MVLDDYATAKRLEDEWVARLEKENSPIQPNSPLKDQPELPATKKRKKSTNGKKKKTSDKQNVSKEGCGVCVCMVHYI